MTKQEKMEYNLHIQMLYDEWLMKTEKRGISYGEIAYMQGLSKKELNDLETALVKELEENNEKN